MAVKASSYLTRNKRLRDPREQVDRFMERARHLGPKLGPVLLQLPPTMRAETGRLDGALSCFPSGVRVVVEARHESWGPRRGVGGARRQRRRVVHRRRALATLAGRAHCGLGLPPVPRGRRLTPPLLRRRALATWADRIAKTWTARADVYAFFNNDTCACAPRDAARFATTCRRVGLGTTKLPARGTVTLCA